MTEEQTAAIAALRALTMGPKGGRSDYVGTLSGRDAQIILNLLEPRSSGAGEALSEPEFRTVEIATVSLPASTQLRAVIAAKDEEISRLRTALARSQGAVRGRCLGFGSVSIGPNGMTDYKPACPRCHGSGLVMVACPGPDPAATSPRAAPDGYSPIGMQHCEACGHNNHWTYAPLTNCKQCHGPLDASPSSSPGSGASSETSTEGGNA